ncbi:MAG: DNA polymerase IV [Candidatus Obscuribacterales bacterium]|nr:DNA polymerase IV [Steroidobacteraceae bacterium]
MITERGDPNLDPLAFAARAILHVDLDAFYASVEQRDRPELRGHPVIVGGLGARGVVATASYEARHYGVHSAMPMHEARTLCPAGKFVAPRMSVYRDVSREVFDVLRRYTPLVEGLSLDEAFLDVTASQTAFGDALKIARDIKQQIHVRTRLTASVGIAANKLVAKIASEMRKPDGFMSIAPSEVNTYLDPMPIRKLFGIGPKTAAQLNDVGIYTLHDLRTAHAHQLQALFGREAFAIQKRAAGIDDRPVLSEWDEKQISTETTFDVDIAAPALLRSELSKLADRTATRLRSKQVAAHGIAVKIRRHDFSTYTRQRRCQPPTYETRAIANLAEQLLDEWLQEHPGAAVRLLGVGAYDLGSVVQLSLLDAPTTHSNAQLDSTVDRIRAKFGGSALIRGSALSDPTPSGSAL